MFASETSLTVAKPKTPKDYLWGSVDVVPGPLGNISFTYDCPLYYVVQSEVLLQSRIGDRLTNNRFNTL